MEKIVKIEIRLMTDCVGNYIAINAFDKNGRGETIPLTDSKAMLLLMASYMGVMKDHLDQKQ